MHDVSEELWEYPHQRIDSIMSVSSDCIEDDDFKSLYN